MSVEAWMGVNLGLLNGDSALVERSLAQLARERWTDGVIAKLRDAPRDELKRNVERALKTMTR